MQNIYDEFDKIVVLTGLYDSNRMTSNTLSLADKEMPLPANMVTMFFIWIFTTSFS
jgi:hypothetical protein